MLGAVSEREETLQADSSPYALEFPEPEYRGPACGVEKVEELRLEYQGRHQSALERFRAMDSEYGAAAGGLTASMEAGATQLDALRRGPTAGERVLRALSKIGLAKRRPPASEVLESQLETVQTQIVAMARLRERMDAQAVELEGEIRRLGQRVTESARNEEAAAQHVLALSRALAGKEDALLYWDADDRDSAAYHETASSVDELKAQIRLHGSKARGFDHAERRLASILDMNRHFLEMLRHAGENMAQLTAAADQVVDELSGTVRALTTLSLANEMALDLMEATRALKAGIGEVAALASTTSLELTRGIDQFVTELSVYDQDTIDLVASNVSEERRLRQQQVDDAIAHALANPDLA